MKRFGAHGRETARTVLADAHDPASQLRERWPVGLRVIRKGWLELPDALVKPLQAGALCAGRIRADETSEARQHHGDEDAAILGLVMRLASDAIKMPGGAAPERLATASRTGPSRLADGRYEGCTKQVIDTFQSCAGRDAAPVVLAAAFRAASWRIA